jgi:hypothetical protein
MFFAIVYHAALDLCKYFCCSVVLRQKTARYCSEEEEKTIRIALKSQAIMHASLTWMVEMNVLLCIEVVWQGMPTKLAMPDGHVQSTGDSLVPNLAASPQ